MAASANINELKGFADDGFARTQSLTEPTPDWKSGGSVLVG